MTLSNQNLDLAIDYQLAGVISATVKLATSVSLAWRGSSAFTKLLICA
jgi:hypothetical protein